ncbi:hypothetical protein BKA69DRAFT_293894 [Paraphysoderma sedebokerense]|nr:hypothetical protein BKA69DRAFT_293894 [Paraphysoderma sedebokerense]
MFQERAMLKTTPSNRYRLALDCQSVILVQTYAWMKLMLAFFIIFMLLKGCHTIPITEQAPTGYPDVKEITRNVLNPENSKTCVNDNEGTCGEYRLVGYHGSCSNFKKSLETGIMIPGIGGTTNYKKSQLGNSRFYMADSARAAYLFACRNFLMAHPIKGIFMNPKPIVCRVFAKSDVLSTIPSVYVPSQLPMILARRVKATESKLWYNEENMSTWERLFFGPSSETAPVRFSKIWTGNEETHADEQQVLGTLQTAWPTSLFKYLKSECNIVNYSDSIVLSDVGYAGVLKGQDWGVKVYAANLYKPMRVIPMRQGKLYLHRNDD